MDEYRFGTPSLAEWRGLWLASPAVEPHSKEEYQGVWKELEDRLRAHFHVSQGEIGPAYFRGDDPGDRTQSLEIANPDVLTPQLLLLIQQWLREPRMRNWRVIVTTLGEDDDLVLYPYAIIGINGHCTAHLGEYVSALVRQLKQWLSNHPS